MKNFNILPWKTWGDLYSKILDLGHEFIKKKYAKVQGFAVRKDTICKSRRDRYRTSTSFKCAAEDERLAQHVGNTDRVRKAKDKTHFGCKAERRFKWIRETDHWIVTRFVAEHTHPLANADQVLYLRLDNVSF